MNYPIIIWKQTKILLHATCADSNIAEEAEIVVRGSDTDILVIMIYHCKNLEDTSDGESSRDEVDKNT